MITNDSGFVINVILYVFFKFVYINSSIYLELRESFSKTYLRKNKSKNIFNKLFYVNYKDKINKFLFGINIIYFVSGVMGTIILLLSSFIKNKYIECYIYYLAVLYFFSCVIWATSGMLYKIKTYSFIQKILYLLVSAFSSESVFARIEYQILRETGMKIIWHFVK